MTRRDIPNLISMLRIGLVVPIVWFALQEQYAVALLIFILAGVSDALDGFLAKRYDWGSHLGGWLDPIADKIMLVSVYVVLTYQQQSPAWLLGAVVGRDLIIVAGGVAYYFLVEKVNAAPSWISKLNTVLQIAYAIVLLTFLSFRWDFGLVLVDAMVYAVLFTTVLSGVDYVWIWGRRAWLRKQEAK